MGNPSNEWDKGGVYNPGWDNPDNSKATTLPSDEESSEGTLSCPAERIAYKGIDELKTSLVRINNTDLYSYGDDEDSISLVLLKGFIPRSPIGEESGNESSFPTLSQNCWWVTETGKFGYNCYGYCQGRLQVYHNYKNGKPLSENLGNALTVNENKETAFQFYQNLGLIFQEKKSPSEKSLIAFYEKGHVAWKSDYYFGENRLWESKLGHYGGSLSIRILCSLQAIEQGTYGSVTGFFEIT